MANADFNLREINQLIIDSINGNKESLHAFEFSPWFTENLWEISERTAYKYKLDASDIRDAVFDKLSENIKTIENKNNSPLTDCILSWCHQCAKYWCLNQIRHNRVEGNYRVRSVAAESINGSVKSAEGAPLPIRSSDPNSPAETLLEKEAAALREQLSAAIYSVVKQELDNSCPIDLRIVILSGAGKMTLKQISDVTHLSVSTVQRHLVAWQKGVLKKNLPLLRLVNKDPANRLAIAYKLILFAVKKSIRAA
ncbi:MAG TPA: hypothetical protein VGN10_06565 [Pyrinomonadaceae bacterium]